MKVLPEEKYSPESGKNSELLPDFALLSPEYVADAAEAVLDERVDGTLVTYPSYVNRVYGLTDINGNTFIAKFYRPGRWSEQALREEHAFIAECAGAGIPVPQPIQDAEGETLSTICVENENGTEQDFCFALFPYIRSRGWEPESDESFLAMGRLMAALHAVGARKVSQYRPEIHPEKSTRPALRRLLDGELIHPDVRKEFEDVCTATLDTFTESFHSVKQIRLHGDLHRGNALQANEDVEKSGNTIDRDLQPILIDFDDMSLGPAVQDLWLFLPGRIEDSKRELGLLIEGYDEIGSFDRSTIGLIEPLRFMRMIGYLDWQARQRFDANFQHSFPDWGGRAFWIKELEDLLDQKRVILSNGQT